MLVTSDVFMDGKLVKPEQFCHAFVSLIAELVLILGKLVSPEQFIHAPWLPSPNTVTLEKSSSGKLVKPEQSAHAPAMFPLIPEVSIDGNEVRLLKPRHVPTPAVAPPRLPVAEEKSRAGKEVKEEHLFQVL